MVDGRGRAGREKPIRARLARIGLMKAAHPVRTRVAGDRGTGSVNLIAAALLTPVRRWAMVTVGLRARWSTTSAPDELSVRSENARQRRESPSRKAPLRGQVSRYRYPCDKDLI
jgi:hypothetical protein